MRPMLRHRSAGFLIASLLAALAAACTGPQANNHAPAALSEAAQPASPTDEKLREGAGAQHGAEPASAAPSASDAQARQGAPVPRPAPGTIGYAGFGPARFGGTPEAVRMAWGGEMIGGPGEPGGCYYLFPEPPALNGFDVAFMIEKDRFARVDVDTAGIEAPGGGRVGMTLEEIRQRYPGIEEQPHKYVQGGKSLRHRDASGSVLVFETDPAGKVTAWRIGVPPQVDYVEGCS